MAEENSPGTSWEAPKKQVTTKKTPSSATPIPDSSPGSAVAVDKRRRALFYFIAIALMMTGLVIIGIFVVPFVRAFIAMANHITDNAVLMEYVRDVVNNGISTLIGFLIFYGGYKLFHATWHPKPDMFPLKPSKPGQVLKPGE